MKKVILAKKLGMTQLIAEDGIVNPVTVVKVYPVHLVDFMTNQKNSYNALRLAAVDIESKKLNKCDLGQFNKSGLHSMKYIFELRISDPNEYKDVKVFSIDLFSTGNKIILSSMSKGKGFTGTIRKHGFKRGPETHGSKNHRLPGSIGAGTSPSRVLKGTKMAGKHGNKMVNSPSRIVKIDPSRSLMYIQGGIAGANGSLLKVYSNEN